MDLAQECAETDVLALCDSGQCELFWCRAVALSLESNQPLLLPRGERADLPGALHLHLGMAASFPPSKPFIVRVTGLENSFPRIERPPAEEGRVFNQHDVVRKLIQLRKPGDVAAWWAEEPRANPTSWSHPLSTWELKYLQAMASPTVPAPLRMRPPVDPSHLTPEEAREAEQWRGGGGGAALRYAHFENRRRIVAHYVLMHPATIRLQVGLYELVRDSNPLHFALERGWQVGGGKEMFTEQDVSRLGAAAEFFAALAVGVAVEKAMAAAHPLGASSLSAPFMTPEVESAFVEAVRVRAAHMVEFLSNNERGPVLTGVLDTRTGRTFFGINQAEPIRNLHPLLKKRLEDYLGRTGGVTPPRAGIPGAHSEIVALNRALYEREAAIGRPVQSNELSEFVLHNRALAGSRKIQGVPPPCENCNALLPPEIRILP